MFEFFLFSFQFNYIIFNNNQVLEPLCLHHIAHNTLSSQDNMLLLSLMPVLLSSEASPDTYCLFGQLVSLPKIKQETFLL